MSCKVNNEEAYPVCKSLSETAEHILKHSFAIHRVDEDTARVIGTSWLEAKRFFASPDDEKASLHRIVHGNLHGYHIPSEAKMLYRAFCGSREQPWPNCDFQSASERVAENLHRLLLDCYNEMMKLSNSDAYEDKTPTKRLKKTSPFDLPSSANDTDSCPLDYFFYHGDKPDAVSCSEHVDRGVLICVCLTNVPGLEVLPRDSSEYYCPEVEIHNTSLYSEKQVYPALVCIMAGDQLKQILPEVRACVHRVRNKLKQSRLSISYELRA